MDLYDAIFYRKSTKKFSNNRVSLQIFDEVKNICNSINGIYLNNKIKTYPILKGDSLKFIIKKKNRIISPHYIVITKTFDEDNQHLKENKQYLYDGGYVGEEVVLKLTQLGLATCWLDNSFNKESVKDFVHLEEGEEAIALIAFGFSDSKESLFRENDKKLDRKEIKDISKNIDDVFVPVLDIVRYAPSYKNLQPWLFYQDGENINIYIRKKHKSDMTNVDIGIALRHFDIGCEKQNIEPVYSKEEVKNKFRKEYVLTISH